MSTEQAEPTSEPCVVCGGVKEPSRVKSLKCRSCDAGGRRGRKGPSKRLTVDIPRDVWERLHAEALALTPPKSIGEYMADRIIAADKRRYPDQ